MGGNIPAIGGFNFMPYMNTSFMDVDLGAYDLTSNFGSIFSGCNWNSNPYYIPPASNFSFGNNASSGGGTNSSTSGSTSTGTSGTNNSGYTGGWGNYYDNMFAQSLKYRDFMHQYNMDNKKMQRKEDSEINGPERAMNLAAEELQAKIYAKERGQVMEAYKEFLNTVKRAYPDMEGENLKAQAFEQYQRATGKSLLHDIKANQDSIAEGFNSNAAFGLFGNRSSEDNYSELTGLAPGKQERNRYYIGKVGGSGLWGLLGGALAKIGGCGWKGAAVVGVLSAVANGLLTSAVGSKS